MSSPDLSKLSPAAIKVREAILVYAAFLSAQGEALHGDLEDAENLEEKSFTRAELYALGKSLVDCYAQTQKTLLQNILILAAEVPPK